MSTITKERLREHAREKVKSLEFAVTQTAFANSRAELEEELELARIALASLEADPVGEVIEQQSGMMLDGLVISEKPTYRNIKGIHNMKMMPLGTQFYTAPPAPVSVPDEAIRSAVDEIMATYAGSADECRKLVRKHIEDACRAAMLQGADGNSPVIPDGWVVVPVEPTEEMNKAGWTAMNEHDAINPTYRAMLAAAPQQEADNE
ncbi:TPA: hypothetical protein ACQZHT_004531 [Enterobacter hormaechei]